MGSASAFRGAGGGTAVTTTDALTPRDLWIAEKARRAGYADAGAFAAAHALKPYRIAQLYRAAAKELAADVAGVTVLPKELRAALGAEGFAFDAVAPVVVQHSRDGQTIKGLFRLHDGNEVEAVLMQHYGERNTVCISSQAGCAYAAPSVRPGRRGFTRHLSATEIFDQARYFARHLAARGPARSPTSCSWGWASRSTTTMR